MRVYQVQLADRDRLLADAPEPGRPLYSTGDRIAWDEAVRIGLVGADDEGGEYVPQPAYATAGTEAEQPAEEPAPEPFAETGGSKPPTEFAEG